MTVQQFYPIYLQYPEICIDSRKAGPNSIFFAIKGERFDGNDFVQMALENGCNWAIIDNPSFYQKGKTVLVEDALTFLQNLAAFHRDQLDIPVLGLTGTNGKTTTKELIATVLAEQYDVVATKGNLNNHIGVPLTILRANKQTQILLVEMGANHQGEIKFLAAISKPTHGLITNIGRAHLEGFGSFEGVINAKKELYDYLIACSGIIFVNQQDELLISLLDQYSYIPYGNESRQTPHVKLIPDFMLGFSLSIEGKDERQQLDVKTKLVGSYNLSNALAALSVGNYFGVEWEDGAAAISQYVPEMNRSEFRKTEMNSLILDAYNANPSSMQEVIRNFDSLEMSNKLAILGDMRELGKYAAQFHIEILNLLIQKELDFILIGEEFSKLVAESTFKSFQTVEECIEELKKHPIEGKNILLKGSRGIQLEKLIPYL